MDSGGDERKIARSALYRLFTGSSRSYGAGSQESHGVTITLMLISMLCGTLLGLRYKIFVLVPATALIGLAVSTTEAAAGQSTTHIFFATILSAIGLQTGYLWQAFRSIAARSRGTRRASKVGLVL
jgi:hypothetical protein